jgi:hypothetical protein
MAFASSSTSKPGAGVVTYRHLLSKQSLTPQYIYIYEAIPIVQLDLMFATV